MYTDIGSSSFSNVHVNDAKCSSTSNKVSIEDNTDFAILKHFSLCIMYKDSAIVSLMHSNYHVTTHHSLAQILIFSASVFHVALVSRCVIGKCCPVPAP